MAFPSQEKLSQYSIPMYRKGDKPVFTWRKVKSEKLSSAILVKIKGGRLVSIPFQCGGDLTENYLMDKNGQPWCIFCLQKYVQQIRADFDI